jgi:hypothetical protein
MLCGEEDDSEQGCSRRIWLAVACLSQMCKFSGLESLSSTLIGDLIQVKSFHQNLKLSAHEEREKMGGAV